jgi:hypothetical protein
MDRYVAIHDGAAPPALCEALVRLHDYASAQGGSIRVEGAYRRCTAVPIPDPEIPGAPELFEAWKAAVKPAVDAYKARFGTGTLSRVSQVEQAQVICYDPGAAEPEHFAEHADAWNADSATRALSLILFLNDVAEGGETFFPSLDLSVSPREGKLVVFPSAFTHTHVARRPVSGKKYAVVSWLHFDGAVRYRTFPF